MRPIQLLIVSVVVSSWAVVPAHAQSTRRPDLNLFGRGLRDPQQQMSLRASLGASFYDTITKQEVLPGQSAPPDHGWGSFASAALSYNVKLANLNFDGSIGSFASYYPQQAQAFRTRSFPGGGANVGWSFDVAPRTHLNIGSSLRYRPVSLESTLPLAGTPGGGIASDVSDDATLAFLPRDLERVEGQYLSASTDVSLSHDFSRRWSGSATYGLQRDFAFGTASKLGVWSENAGAVVHFLVTRNLSVRGGYRHSESHYTGGGRPFHGNSADIGVDYGQGLALQLTRKTRLTLGGGAGGYVDRSGGQRYRVNGRAVLSHDIGRTWDSQLSYARGLDASQLLFQEPLLTDTASASLNGLISRRLGFHASGSGQRGSVGFVGDGRGILRIVANTGLQTSLGRHFAIGMDYTYYKFRFESAVARLPGVPAHSSSQGVSVHLSTWAPIFRRGRNATR